MPELTAAQWSDFLAACPGAHLLQTAAWGELKAAFGWEVERFAAPAPPGAQPAAGAQVLFRRLPLGLSFAYLPKGPVGDPSAWESLWPELDRRCRARRAVLLKIEPDLWEPPSLDPSNPFNPFQNPLSNPLSGFRLSPHAIQPARTLLVDLAGAEEQLLARMKQKTRYNLRLAIKRGVVVRPSADLDLFYRLVETTGRRDGFGVHALAYYRRAYELFHPAGECELLLAELDNQPLAALMVFAYDRRAWYLFGASSDLHRDAMPTYLLQWEAMRWARQRGCTVYDLWGVPDAPEPALEAGFNQRSDGLWGVYRFKRGFGGELRRSAGPWDRVYRPWLYPLYRLWSRRVG